LAGCLCCPASITSDATGYTSLSPTPTGATRTSHLLCSLRSVVSACRSTCTRPRFGRRRWLLAVGRCASFGTRRTLRRRQACPTIRAGDPPSRWLILMTSPHAAASRWVREEVRIWLAKDPATSRILVSLTDGQIVIAADGCGIDPTATNALPPELVAALTHMPLWIDLRPARSTADAGPGRRKPHRQRPLRVAPRPAAVKARRGPAPRTRPSPPSTRRGSLR
jgi:hypothetical protein